MLLFVFLVVGLISLYIGANKLITTSCSVAKSFGVTKFIAGLTIVGLAMSSPELFVTLFSLLEEKPDIAIATIIGSNICNILLVVGISSCIQPITVAKQLVLVDLPLMIVLSVLLPLLMLRGHLERFDGAILLLLAITYIYLQYTCTEKTHLDIEEDKLSLKKTLMHMAIASVFLAVGAYLFLESALMAAEALQINPPNIAVILIAFGVSLPEIVSGIIASIKKESNISIGNIIGANIYNISVILAVGILIKPVVIPNLCTELSKDLTVMVLASLVLYYVSLARGKICRLTGLLFLLLYGMYATATL